jgi:hypothetical protein
MSICTTHFVPRWLSPSKLWQVYSTTLFVFIILDFVRLLNATFLGHKPIIMWNYHRLSFMMSP